MTTRDLVGLIVVIAAAPMAAAPGQPPQPPEEPPPLVRPGAPGQAPRLITPEEATDRSGISFVEADVRFMQGMIGHHQQAIEMCELVAARTTNESILRLAQRITISQEDEIRMMQDWLRARGQPLPDLHAHHQHGAVLMPGMLTPEEMARLAAARGPEFDRLFLEGMIKHHLGALVMVEQLFAVPGAGQEGEIFAFASDVEADQRMEIERMLGMLREMKQ